MTLWIRGKKPTKTLLPFILIIQYFFHKVKLPVLPVRVSQVKTKVFRAMYILSNKQNNTTF